MRISASLFFCLAASAAQAQSPPSAIDWLSESVATPVAAPNVITEPPATGSASLDEITVTPLDGPLTDAVGLLPASVTGLPRNLWGPTPSSDIAELFRGLDSGMLPAAQELLFTMLLAELDPPFDSDPAGTLFLARVDTLLGLGAVEQAQALLDRAGPDDPDRFRRWFDARLLTGTEAAACDHLGNNPHLAPTLPVRIFCLARNGDWNAAALTLETGRALGQMTGAEDALLTRFLNAEVFEGAPALPAPARPSPLIYRLHEAIGEALPTTTLPLAFAQTDLSPNAGWKAQLEAAERLVRSGALSANQFLGIYTERQPAASGGVWDRVAAVQALDRALERGDLSAAETALPLAWIAAERAELEVVMAELYADKLDQFDMGGEAAEIGMWLKFLGPGYEEAAISAQPNNAEQAFLVALARGDLKDAPATDDFAAALRDGFAATEAPAAAKHLVDGGEIGAAILTAVAWLGDGARGNLGHLSDAIALFRVLGLEDTARRAALQVMVLDRRG